MGTDVDTPTGEPLDAGRAALSRGDWGAARDHLRAAVAADASNPAAWEDLAWAAWWLSDAPTVFDARPRAFRLYRAAGDAGAAARVAAWLAADFREFRGEDAVGRGWLVRARRLLDQAPPGPDHGWVAVIDGDFALNVDGDARETERLGSLAAGLGREHGVADLEAVGLGLSGIALVLQGEIEAGMRALDEASAIAAGEELEYPVSGAWSLCCVMSACNGIGDFPRAEQWCATIRAFTERWGGRQLIGLCRSNYGRILATAGDWDRAEAELTAAVGDLERSRPGMLAHSLFRLGELRLRQGRSAEARELFERAGPAGLLGLAELALDEDDPAGAADTAERVLRHLQAEDRLSAVPALELLARARARLGELDAAARAADRLAETAERIGTPYLRGRARFAAGEVAAAAAKRDTARQAFEDAVDCLTAGSAIYDAAVARLRLAGALAELGRDQPAAAEIAAAEEVLASLGARRDLERAARADAAAVMSARELEVLRLVAQGLSDPEIAERLVVSPHTVHRHVANIRTKLRLPSRSAAVAYAARAGLL